MNECYEYIESIYRNPKINELIKNIKPTELQDDLKQEMAIVLLEYDCDKIKKLFEEGVLLSFACKIVWKMGTLQNGYFYKTYKKKDIEKAVEYLQSLIGNKINRDSIIVAKNVLKNKMLIDANEAHESILFEKYVELKSCTKVAEYFGIPPLHAFQVIKKMKKELKDAINKKL